MLAKKTSCPPVPSERTSLWPGNSLFGCPSQWRKGHSNIQSSGSSFLLCWLKKHLAPQFLLNELHSDQAIPFLGAPHSEGKGLGDQHFKIQVGHPGRSAVLVGSHLYRGCWWEHIYIYISYIHLSNPSVNLLNSLCSRNFCSWIFFQTLSSGWTYFKFDWPGILVSSMHGIKTADNGGKRNVTPTNPREGARIWNVNIEVVPFSLTIVNGKNTNTHEARFRRKRYCRKA